LDKAKKSAPEPAFEEALAGLEEIASKLESGELGLDDSIKLFEKGIQLAAFCHKKLEEAERKIEILQKGGSDVVARQVAVKSGTGEIEDDEDIQGSLI
jgi:exodeoxyribonuclease VII small subunit